MAGLARWLASRQWTSDAGKYIKDPHRWLLKRMWLDQPEPATRETPKRSLVDEILEEERRQKGEQTTVGPGDGREN